MLSAAAVVGTTSLVVVVAIGVVHTSSLSNPRP